MGRRSWEQVEGGHQHYVLRGPLQQTDDKAPILGDPPSGKSLAVSCPGLMVRTMCSTVDPLLAPLDVRPEIQRLSAEGPFTP